MGLCIALCLCALQHPAASAATLALQSGSATPGESVSLPLQLTGATGNGVSSVEFSIDYATARFSSVSASRGAAASNAGKSITCRSSGGLLHCLIYGLNTTALADGTVAVIAATPITAGTTAPLTLTALAASSAGSVINLAVQSGGVTTPPAAKTPTSLTILSSANPATAGQTITFGAAISPVTASGAVQFRDGSTVLGTATLSSGRAFFTTASLGIGTHSIQASYAGTSTLSPSTSGVLAQAVNAAYDCADRRILCVDDQPGAAQEYPTIQAAADAALAGDTVLVHPGFYAGFSLAKSGTASAPLTVRVNGTPNSAVIWIAASSGDGIRLDNVSHVVVEGFTIVNVAGACIAARGATAASPMTNVSIRKNICAGARGLAGIYASQTANSEISGNAITGLTTVRTHGIYLANAGADNTVIRGNTVFNVTGTDAAGIHINGDQSVGGDGIISGAVIDSNTIYRINFNGISMDGVQNSRVTNNLIFGVARAAARAFRIDGAQGPKGLRFVNNSFHSTGGWAIKLSEDLGGHTVFNNILLTNSSAAGSICIGTTNGFNSSANAVVDRFSRDDETTVISLATWQNSGFDTSSFVSTAAVLFNNIASGDYRLATGSPAVDKGISSFNGAAAPSVDRAGISRPRGAAIDLGAFEQ
jgi:hypothetical protein